MTPQRLLHTMAALALAFGGPLATSTARAQAAAPAAAKPAAARPAAAKPAAPPPASQRRGPPRPPEVVLPAAPGEQLAAAAMTHFGPYDCEFNEKVSVEIHTKTDGYIDVKHRNRTWTMKPVLSHTGALRLEDVKGRMLMLQIADKSMLMDTQIGQRVVDNCVHEKQREAMLARQGKPAGDSIGIDPSKSTETTTAAAPAAPAASATAAPR